MEWKKMMRQQKALCANLQSEFWIVDRNKKIGMSRNMRKTVLPINGLRIKPENGTTGWYIWAGQERSLYEDFFLNVHVEHIDSWSPDILKFLALPPGWRFVKADGYENVWFDESLLSDYD